MLRGGLAVISVLTGSYMVFDGMRKLLIGSYFGPGLGPWAGVVRALGVDPMSMGVVFVVLGVLWLFFLAAILARKRSGWYGGLVVAVATLWYLPLGTAFSVVYVALLLRYRSGLVGT